METTKRFPQDLEISHRTRDSHIPTSHSLSLTKKKKKKKKKNERRCDPSSHQPAAGQVAASATSRTGKNNCRQPAKVIDVDQPASGRRPESGRSARYDDAPDGIRVRHRGRQFGEGVDGGKRFGPDPRRTSQANRGSVPSDKCFGINGEPGRNRTFNPQIKRCPRRASTGLHGVAGRQFSRKSARHGIRSYTLDNQNSGQNSGQE